MEPITVLGESPPGGEPLLLPYHLLNRAGQLIDHLRTLSARLVARHSIGPRALEIRLWAWLVAQTNVWQSRSVVWRQS
jgi:hypothetical protein